MPLLPPEQGPGEGAEEGGGGAGAGGSEGPGGGAGTQAKGRKKKKKKAPKADPVKDAKAALVVVSSRRSSRRGAWARAAGCTAAPLARELIGCPSPS